jgi:hypothetical protein
MKKATIPNPWKWAREKQILNSGFCFAKGLLEFVENKERRWHDGGFCGKEKRENKGERKESCCVEIEREKAG